MSILVRNYFNHFVQASHELYRIYKQQKGKRGVMVGMLFLKEDGANAKFSFEFLSRSFFLKDDDEILAMIDDLDDDEFILYIGVDDEFYCDIVHKDEGKKDTLIRINYIGKNNTPCSNRPLCKDMNAKHFCKKCKKPYCGRPCQKRDQNHKCGFTLI